MAEHMNFSVEINVLGLDLKATGIYTPGDPGRLSGPPEKCYPPEPAEVDVHTLVYLKWDMMPLIVSDVSEEIHEKCIAAVEEGLE